MATGFSSLYIHTYATDRTMRPLISEFMDRRERAAVGTRHGTRKQLNEAGDWSWES